MIPDAEGEIRVAEGEILSAGFATDLGERSLPPGLLSLTALARGARKGHRTPRRPM